MLRDACFVVDKLKNEVINKCKLLLFYYGAIFAIIFMTMVNATNIAHKEPSMALTPSRKSSSFYISSLLTHTSSANSISSKGSEQNSSSPPPSQSISEIASQMPDYSMMTSYTLPEEANVSGRFYLGLYIVRICCDYSLKSFDIY